MHYSVFRIERSNIIIINILCSIMIREHDNNHILLSESDICYPLYRYMIIILSCTGGNPFKATLSKAGTPGKIGILALSTNLHM